MSKLDLIFNFRCLHTIKVPYKTMNFWIRTLDKRARVIGVRFYGDKVEIEYTTR